MVVSGVLRSRPNLVPRALFLGFEARGKRPGDEVGVGHAPVAIFMSFVGISSSLMSLFQGHVPRRNFTLTGPLTLKVSRVTNINFLLTTSADHQQ